MTALVEASRREMETRTLDKMAIADILSYLAVRMAREMRKEAIAMEVSDDRA